MLRLINTGTGHISVDRCNFWQIVRLTRLLCIALAIHLANAPVGWCADEKPVTEEGSSEAPPPKRRPAPKVNLLDVRGDPDLIVCSQNLKLFGTYDNLSTQMSKLSKEDYRTKVSLLVARFTKAQCDVIAVQEVMGRTEELAEKALQVLAARLLEVSNRRFQVRVGPPGDGGMGVGYLVAEDRAEIANTVSYKKVELPKLVAKQKPRLFSRSPLELQLTVASRETGLKKSIVLVNFHFKSKRAGAGDPSGLEWETFRMEMAEALRRIVERRLRSSFAAGDTILMMLGDRNSNFDVASARILEGTLALKSFQDTAPCRLTKRGAPICKAGESYPQRLFSVLTTNASTKSLPGTFSYKGEYSWLDEILMPAESLPFAWTTATSEGAYSSGVMYTPKDASDHAMVYVRLNW